MQAAVGKKDPNLPALSEASQASVQLIPAPRRSSSFTSRAVLSSQRPSVRTRKKTASHASGTHAPVTVNTSQKPPPTGMPRHRKSTTINNPPAQAGDVTTVRSASGNEIDKRRVTARRARFLARSNASSTRNSNNGRSIGANVAVSSLVTERGVRSGGSKISDAALCLKGESSNVSLPGVRLSQTAELRSDDDSDNVADSAGRRRNSPAEAHQPAGILSRTISAPLHGVTPSLWTVPTMQPAAHKEVRTRCQCFWFQD